MGSLSPMLHVRIFKAPILTGLENQKEKGGEKTFFFTEESFFLYRKMGVYYKGLSLKEKWYQLQLFFYPKESLGKVIALFNS